MKNKIPPNYPYSQLPNYPATQLPSSNPTLIIFYLVSEKCLCFLIFSIWILFYICNINYFFKTFSFSRILQINIFKVLIYLIKTYTYFIDERIHIYSYIFPSIYFQILLMIRIKWRSTLSVLIHDIWNFLFEQETYVVCFRYQTSLSRIVIKLSAKHERYFLKRRLHKRNFIFWHLYHFMNISVFKLFYIVTILFFRLSIA